MEVLKGAPPPHEKITLGCSAYSEESCVFAGQFLNLFKRAGWPLQVDGVERVNLTRPIAGVVLFTHGEGKYDPSAPDSGLWTKITPDRDALEEAFSNLDLDPESSADGTIPEGEVRIFFGIEPSEEETEARRALRQKRLESIRQVDSDPEFQKLIKK